MALRSVVLMTLVMLAGGCGDPPKPRSGDMEGRMAKKDGAGRGEAGLEQEEKEGVDRKVIYKAMMHIQVEDFLATLEKLRELVKEVKGRVEKAEETGVTGVARRASLTVRVPADALDDFRVRAARLGEVRLNRVESEDVTGRYYDAEAEMKTLEAEEEALRALLKDRKAAATDDAVLKLRDHAVAARVKINGLKSRLKVWDSQVRMSTVELEINERTAYVPQEAAPFGTRLGRTWGDSLGVLGSFLQGLLLAFVAVIPWALLAALFVVPAVLVIRARRAATPPAPPPPPQQTVDDDGSSPPTVVIE